MPKFDAKVIKEYGKKIAKALQVVIKCDEFGKTWHKDNKDCKLCKIDSPTYHTKCREFTKGEGAGYRPRVTTYKKKKKKFPQKVTKIVYKAKKRMLQPFRRQTRCDIIYRFIKEKEAVNIRDIMRHLSEHFECDIEIKTVRNYIDHMRKELKKIDHEVIKNYRGCLYIEKTSKGNCYGNTNEARALKADKLQKEREEENNDNEISE